jgi:hypothetical protein
VPRPAPGDVLAQVLNEAGLRFRHWIAIDIKYSPPIAGRLYPAHYSLLYYSKARLARFSRPRVRLIGRSGNPLLGGRIGRCCVHPHTG